ADDRDDTGGKERPEERCVNALDGPGEIVGEMDHTIVDHRTGPDLSLRDEQARIHTGKSERAHAASGERGDEVGLDLPCECENDRFEVSGIAPTGDDAARAGVVLGRLSEGGPESVDRVRSAVDKNVVRAGGQVGQDGLGSVSGRTADLHYDRHEVPTPGGVPG